MQPNSDAKTDPGQIRELNEDSIYLERRAEKIAALGELLVVADGMGGHDSGEVASQQAIETIAESYYAEPKSNPTMALKRAIERANAIIFQRAQREHRQGMGTTVVAAVRVADQLHVAHVGDSRIYLIRRGDIRALTRDHSLVAEQVEAGILTPEEAARHPHRNVISRAVGTAPQVEVEVAEAPLRLQSGDIVLLCSDGLTEHLSPSEILAVTRDKPPQAATQALIDAANVAGGSDNISVIVVQVGEVAAREAITNRFAAVSRTEPLPAPAGETAARTPQKGPPRRRRWPLLLLSVLVVGAVAGVGWGYWSGALFGAAPPGPAPTASPTGTATVAAPGGLTSRTPSAVPPSGTLVPLTPVASLTVGSTTPTAGPTATAQGNPDGLAATTPGPARQVTLLAPDEGLTAGPPITFRAQVTNVQPDDIVQLRLGQSEATLSYFGNELVQVGEAWEVTVPAPPGDRYGEWVWAVFVTTSEPLSNGGFTFYRSVSRRLLWNP